MVLFSPPSEAEFIEGVLIFSLDFFMKEANVGSVRSLCWIKQMFSTLADVKFPALGPSFQKRIKLQKHSSSPSSNECSLFSTYPNKPRRWAQKRGNWLILDSRHWNARYDAVVGDSVSIFHLMDFLIWCCMRKKNK